MLTTSPRLLTAATRDPAVRRRAQLDTAANFSSIHFLLFNLISVNINLTDIFFMHKIKHEAELKCQSISEAVGSLCKIYVDSV